MPKNLIDTDMSKAMKAVLYGVTLGLFAILVDYYYIPGGFY